MSLSKGEQIPFRQMTDSEYLNIERRANENGVSFAEQMDIITEVHIDDFKEVQEVNQSTSHKSM